MECVEISLLKCPKCNRVLKPSIKEGKLHITVFQYQSLMKVKSHDLLVCRYCKLSVKTSLLRKQKDPIKFLKQFAKAPLETEIS